MQSTFAFTAQPACLLHLKSLCNESDGASLVAQMVKKPPAVRESWVQSLGWEDPLVEGIATQTSILAWRIPMEKGA